MFWYARDFWSNSAVEGYLSGINNQQLLILDLYSEMKPVWNVTMSYFGKPFIWNTLHNFGGTVGN